MERRVAPDATGLAGHGWTDAQAAAFAEACRVAGFAEVTVLTRTCGRETVLVVRAVRP